VSTGNNLLAAPTDGDSPLTKEHTLDQIPQALQEYGYGFWMRYLTHYPVRMWSGKNGPWYFLVRLTVNNPHADAGFGDRILAIWQGQGYYHFTSCNSDDGNPNYTVNADYPEDIEGLWTYVYYSHGKQAKKSVGFIQYGNQGKPTRIQHAVQHPLVTYLKFILAGKHLSYPGFNGQFYNVNYRVGPGAYIDSIDQFNTWLTSQGASPAIDWDRTVTLRQITGDPVGIKPGDASEEYKQIGGGDNMFPPEYSVSGWFKWAGPYAGWHLVFRLTTNNKADNQDASRLGDRTITVFDHPNQHYYPVTYHYANMNAAGDANKHTPFKHDTQNQVWHYIYFGYSKAQQRAFFFVQFRTSSGNQDYPKTNHYWTEKFWFVLRDARYANFNG
jgi:hypothetical protein